MAESDDETAEPAAADDDTDGRDDPPPARRRALDTRTIAICVVVALIAALVAGLVTAQLTDDESAADTRTEAQLTRAEEVPDVALERFDGTEVSPADYRGQPLVMNFWASWCVPCTEEMPAFQEVHESLGDDVAFLGVNVRDVAEEGESMVARTGVTYDVARDTSGDLARELGIANLPVTVIVAPDGTVLETLHTEVSSARLCEVVNQTLLSQSLDEAECG